MTLAELRTLLRKLIGSPNTTDVPDADLTEFINVSYDELSNRYFHRENKKRTTFSSVVGQASYNLNASDLTIYQVWNKTRMYQLEKRGYEGINEIDRTSHSSAANEWPLYYYRGDSTITLYPTPSEIATFEIVSKRSVTALVNNTDVPALPSTWHRSIAYRARWDYYDQKGDFPKAQYALNALNQYLSTLPSPFDEEQRGYFNGVSLPGLNLGVARPTEDS